MEIVISIAAKIAEYTVAPIGHQLGYLFYYKKNVEELKTQIKEWEYARERLQRKVEDAGRNGEVIEAVVEEFLTNVGDFTKEIETFTGEEEQSNTKCSIIGAKFPNLVLRHRLSRRAKKMAQIVVTQIQQVEKFKEVSYRPRQPISSATENEGYVEFESRKKNLRDVMEAFKDPSIGKIGVWGMGGVGKTMLSKEVARRSKDEERLFTQVIFITISQTPNLKNIRHDILKGMGMTQLNLENQKELEEYNDRLHNRLSKEDKVLVVVDDVWEKFDLKGVGISFGDDKKGCKILVTSRYQHVLEIDMGIDRNIQVGLLLGLEATRLFYKTLGSQADKHDGDYDFQPLATEIVRECGGLPIAIATVASALKKKSKHVWKNALHELQNSNPINIRGMHDKVYSSIKLSYDFLASDEAKELLLLCGLFGEDENIDVKADLCNYGIGLNLYEGGISTLEEARNRTFTLVGNLNDHSLLLDGTDTSGPNCVKLHDVIRDIVIFIASNKLGDGHGRHSMHTIRNAAELEAYFETGKFKDSKAISLYLKKDDQSPQTLKSAELKILKVTYSGYKWWESKQLGPQFFGALSKLLVLDLRGVALEAFLPASFFGPPFPNLRMLRLNYCKFGNTTTSWIGELKSLRILDLSCSDITELPTEVGNLNRLLSLRLISCSSLKVIRPNVLSRLTHLEDLELQYSFENWRKHDADGEDNASFGELNNLRHLTNLSLLVRDVNCVPKDMMFTEKLESYHIRIGLGHISEWFPYWIGEITSRRTLELDLSSSSTLNEHDFISLLKRSDLLYLRGLKSGVKSVAYELHSGGFPQLKQLAVGNSAAIRCIVDNNYSHHHEDHYPPCPAAPAFPSLEGLLLYQLSNLENVIINIHEEYQKQLITTTTTPETRMTTVFGKLSEIAVGKCHKLRSVISLDNINPRQLKKIKVVDCEMMEEIISFIATCGGDGDHLPKYILEISELCLIELPKLVQFTATTKSDDSDIPFFNAQVEFPKLESLQMHSLYFRKIWNDERPSSKLGFQSLMTVIVEDCHNLKGVIPLSMIGSDLVNLKTLRIENCGAMEEVVFIEEYSAQDAKTSSSTGIKKILFPKLEELLLDRLPNLKRFCSGDCVEKNSEIRRQLPDDQQSCGGSGVEQQDHYDDDDDMVIKTTSSSSREAKASTQNGYSRDIFFFKTSFQSLRTLKVIGLQSVTSLFYSSAVTKSLSQLTELSICDCQSLRHVVVLSPNSDGHDDGCDDDGGGVVAAAAGNNNGNNSSSNIVFSKLESVVLDGLPNLTSFFSRSSSGSSNNDAVLQFPRLNKLTVGPCPKMTTFSHHPAHHIDCPLLRNITVYKTPQYFYMVANYYDLPRQGRRWSGPPQNMWEGDVNSTIQKIWQINNTNTTTNTRAASASSRKLIN